ncbi:MAG: trimethylamine methyltransferase family protein [Roseobacter sp.]
MLRVIKAPSKIETVEIANHTDYGLAASVFSAPSRGAIRAACAFIAVLNDVRRNPKLAVFADHQKLSQMLPAIHLWAHHIAEPCDPPIIQRRIASVMRDHDRTFAARFSGCWQQSLPER